MIEKFKKGGTKKQGSILAQIQQLPKQLLELVLQAFSQWAEQKGIDINQLLQDLNALEEALGMFMLELQGAQALKARLGAKLNYIKTLKNQCAEDEEVVYYKRGGSVGCGCKKKEDGGEINKETSIAKFKKNKIKKDCGGIKIKKNQKGGKNVYNPFILAHTIKGYGSNPTITEKIYQYPDLKYDNGLIMVPAHNDTLYINENLNVQAMSDGDNRKLYEELKKQFNDNVLMNRLDNKVYQYQNFPKSKINLNPKIKKHQSGGFFGLFTNKGDLPTAPQVEDAYNGGTYSSETPGRFKRWITGRKEVNRVTGPTNVQKVPRMIELVITTDGDTLYRERPAYNPEVVNGAWRGATSKYPDEEYNILKRRFNDARTVVSRFKNSFKNGGNLGQF